MMNLLQRFRSLFRSKYGNNGYAHSEEPGDEERLSGRGDQRQLFTALDIGTAFAKAIIIEIHEDEAIVLGVGRHPQNIPHMADGIITDISGVTANCNEALIEAERSAGGVVAPATIIGIAGELVKGSSVTINKQRSQPEKQISTDEFGEPDHWRAAKIVENGQREHRFGDRLHQY